MDALQKKCLLGSTGLHVLLALILLTAPAFRARNREADKKSGLDESQVIHMLASPAEIEDTFKQQGTVPNASTSQSGSIASSTPINPNSSEPARKQIEHGKLPAVSTTLVGQDSATGKKSNSQHQADSRAADLDRVVQTLTKKLPSGKGLNLDFGEAQGGQKDAYAQIVRFFYTQSWRPAEEGVLESKTPARVSVTIESDGKVSDAHIIESSGDARVDDSVRHTLERVQFIEPFEPGAREAQRTYTIAFNVSS